jgi:poly-gamma-glutamate capsule biosynthesis protein CapA/YwtB (metallophosphatase superfamily)
MPPAGRGRDDAGAQAQPGVMMSRLRRLAALAAAPSWRRLRRGLGIAAGIVAAVVIAALIVWPPGRTVTLVAVGDTMLGRAVAEDVKRRGADWPFDLTCDLSRGADIGFCNLECALSKQAPLLPKRFAFRGDPACARALARAGYDVACLANNHALDCDTTGLTDTLRALHGAGVRALGGGRDREHARAPVILRRRGLRIAFLARSAFAPEGVTLADDRPSIAQLDLETLVPEVIAAARAADVVVVSLHWGIEYSRWPTDTQRQIAHRIVDAGADVVIGHHPHTVQEVERYRGAVIAYSLGNFVFDTSRPRARDGLILRCRLGRDGVRGFDTIPVRLDQHRPRPVAAPS